MAQITLGDLERNPELLHQFIKESTLLMIQYCVRNFKKINKQDAEDIVHNALVKLIEIITERKVQKIDTPTIAWMYQELKRRCVDLMRKRGREEGKIIPIEVIYFLPDPNISTNKEIIRDEIRESLRECIQRMKGKKRKIFELYLEGYTSAEIAGILDVSAAYVSKVRKIGKKNLEKCLTQCGFDADSIRGLFFLE